MPPFCSIPAVLMVDMDPMSALTAGAGRAAGTVLAKAFQPAGRIRLGGREERRLVYAHFQACAIRMYGSATDQTQFTKWGHAFFWRGQRRARERTSVALEAFYEAMAEFALVGNARPLDAGVDLFAAACCVNTDYPLDHRKNRDVEADFYKALDGFVLACREDLLYLPAWWQVWRPAWWKVRWESWRQRRRAKRESRVARAAPAS